MRPLHGDELCERARRKGSKKRSVQAVHEHMPNHGRPFSTPLSRKDRFVQRSHCSGTFFLACNVRRKATDTLRLRKVFHPIQKAIGAQREIWDEAVWFRCGGINDVAGEKAGLTKRGSAAKALNRSASRIIHARSCSLRSPAMRLKGSKNALIPRPFRFDALLYKTTSKRCRRPGPAMHN